MPLRSVRHSIAGWGVRALPSVLFVRPAVCLCARMDATGAHTHAAARTACLNCRVRLAGNDVKSQVDAFMQCSLPHGPITVGHYDRATLVVSDAQGDDRAYLRQRCNDLGFKLVDHEAGEPSYEYMAATRKPGFDLQVGVDFWLIAMADYAIMTFGSSFSYMARRLSFGGGLMIRGDTQCHDGNHGANDHIWRSRLEDRERYGYVRPLIFF